MNEYEISDERVNDFISSLELYDKDLYDIKQHAKVFGIPIIRDETKSFIKMLLKVKKPKRILELGTAIAYSTYIIYKEAIDSIEELVTVENYEKRIEIAKTNIDKYLDVDKVKLVESDITNYLKNTNDNDFDFVFLDAAKAQYITWLPYIKKMMKKDAILVSDNIFKDGEVLESKYYIIKRDRTIHKRMREFLYTISHDEELDTTFFNVGDGISVSIKK